jgi:hypothetical protein
MNGYTTIALVYIAPVDQLERRVAEIHTTRHAKIEAARERRPVNCQTLLEQPK